MCQELSQVPTLPSASMGAKTEEQASCLINPLTRATGNSLARGWAAAPNAVERDVERLDTCFNLITPLAGTTDKPCYKGPMAALAGPLQAGTAADGSHGPTLVASPGPRSQFCIFTPHRLCVQQSQLQPAWPTAQSRFSSLHFQYDLGLPGWHHQQTRGPGCPGNTGHLAKETQGAGMTGWVEVWVQHLSIQQVGGCSKGKWSHLL